MPNKRRNGEGSIRKRKNGRWEARYVDHREPNPAKKRKSVTGKTRSEALEKMKIAQFEMHKNPHLIPNSITLGEWLDRWMNTYKRTTLRATTLAQYEMYIENDIKPLLGHIQLTKLSGVDIQGLYVYLLNQGSHKKGQNGMAPATVYKQALY